MSIRARPGAPEERDLVLREVSLRQEAVAQSIVDVMVDVRDPVDDPDDLALVRCRLLRARVREDPVADLRGQVESLRDPERLLVVPEARAEPVAERLVERLLARVPERRVARVVAEPDRLDEILVEPERTRDDPRDRRRLQRVRHASPVVITLRVDEDLGLPLQPAKRLRVDDPVAVALERRSHAARLLGPEATLRLVRADGERRQPRLLALADEQLEVPRCTIDRLHRLQSNPRRGVRIGAPGRDAGVRTSGTGRRRP